MTKSWDEVQEDLVHCQRLAVLCIHHMMLRSI